MTDREAWDAGPPRDLRTEELYLSALLVQGGRDFHDVTVLHFHDPFHVWLFGKLRVCAAVGGPLHGLPLGHRAYSDRAALWIANLFLKADGESRAGLVEELPQYAARLKEVHAKREQYAEGQRLMVEALK